MMDCEDFFKALSDETRQRILKLLERKPMCVSDIAQAVHVTQPTISHHLDILKRSSMVAGKRKGQHIYYSLNTDSMTDCCADFLSMFKCFTEFTKSYKLTRRPAKGKK